MRFTEENFDATCEACAEVLRLAHPADGVLSGFFRQRPQLGRQDRALIAETVYAVLRRKRLLEFVLGGSPVRQLVLAAWSVLLGANLRAQWNRYRTAYLQTGSFAPVIHATLFFGAAGWLMTYKVKGGTSIRFNICWSPWSQASHRRLGGGLIFLFVRSEHRQVYKWH